MNRLILIGNGFDLAHKLKTSYSDFITDYIARSINNFYENNSHKDCLLSINFKYTGYGHSPEDRTYKVPIAEAISRLDILCSKESIEVNKTPFLEKTIHQLNTKKWVDLENDYFDNLTRCQSPWGYQFDSVQELNEQFEFLKCELENYLIRIQNETNFHLSDTLTELFTGKIRGSDIVTMKIEDKEPDRILFLSFNYTNTVDIYSEQCNKKIPTQVNYIHGKLHSKLNPIIFGFGDEYNKSYLEFEEIKNKELLKHIKSFGYFKSSNYHNLVRFLEAQNFQVYVFGHSLGLSDRTMLKQIFEHENCKSIKLFYHNDQNDFTNKTYDISSHFHDKGVMRKKIVPFDKSIAMPQPG